MAVKDNTIVNATNSTGDYTVNITNKVYVQVEHGQIRIPDDDGFLLSWNSVPNILSLPGGLDSFYCASNIARVNVYEYEANGS